MFLVKAFNIWFKLNLSKNLINRIHLICEWVKVCSCFNVQPFRVFRFSRAIRPNTRLSISPIIWTMKYSSKLVHIVITSGRIIWPAEKNSKFYGNKISYFINSRRIFYHCFLPMSSYNWFICIGISGFLLVCAWFLFQVKCLIVIVPMIIAATQTTHDAEFDFCH